jgi:trimeric autotransporter adhesin
MRLLPTLATGLVPVMVMLAAAPGAAQEAQRCAIAGRITAGTSGLPGVAITVDGFALGKPVSTSSQLDGTFGVPVPGPGRYQVRAELGTFAPAVRDVLVDTSCQARLDIALTIAGATPATGASTGSAGSPTGSTPSRAAASAPARSAPAAGLAGLFQRVAPRVEAGAGQSGGAADDAGAIASQLSLPPGFAPETLSETITASGSSGRTNDSLLFGGLFGGGGTGGAAPAAGRAAATGNGESMAPPAGAGLSESASVRELTDMAGLNMTGGGLGAIVRIAGALQSFNKRPHGLASYDVSGSPLNAAPYSLTGLPIPKPDYLQNRFSATIGGLLKVPGLFDAGPRTMFFLNYGGNRSSTLYSQYSTVPSAALRAGDFAALSTPLVDPVTGIPFAGNRIPADRVTPSARALLSLVPLPNLPGDRLNFYYSTTTHTTSDDVAFRLMRNFGGSGRGRGGPGGTGRNGRPGTAGGRANTGSGNGLAGMLGNLVPGLTGGSVSLNAGFQYRRSVADQANPFPTIFGWSRQGAWIVPVGVTFPLAGLTHNLQFQFNRGTSSTTSAFAGTRDVAAEAGIAGVSRDPFDWGAPSLSFSTFTGLRDLTPSSRTDQTIVVSESASRTRGRHTVRVGGDFRDVRSDSRTSANARGTFLFTGLYTSRGSGRLGADFADYLLGLSQQASVQYGPGLERFRSRAYNLFLVDDWRMRSGVTINAGLRYEYQSPSWEADNRLVTLDVAPGFTAATPVMAGAMGPYAGSFARTIVRPDRNNLAPRAGVAWRASTRTTLRGGYGINYASVPYQSIVERLAAQPHFAVADTRVGTLAAPLDPATVFGTPAAAATTNNFAADPAYRLGYVHIWNADLQRELSRSLSVGVSYVATRGARLDIQRAPNRGPGGTLIPGVQPFIWESSDGRSVMHSVSIRVRRRLAQGFSGGATYTLSRSMDDASTIGGGAVVVAQNDRDLAAEWGLSSFDQRHRLTADFTYELPFGPGRRWLTADRGWSKVLGGWILSGSLSAASGTPFTARVVNDVADVGRGTSGTLRADYDGSAIAVANPTTDRFFNTAAFALPAAGRYGNAARNTIPGPGSAVLNASLQKSVAFTGLRGFSVRIQANNLLNRVQWSSIDTAVNSPTFGHVVAVRPMRSVQVVARVLF